MPKPRRMVIEVIDDQTVEVLRRKTATQRLTSTFDMWRSARDQLQYILRSQNPDWNKDRLRAEFRRRMLGPT